MKVPKINMTIRLQLLAGFSILILFFLIDFFTNQNLSKKVVVNTSYISNSEGVIRNSNFLHKEMIEMQSSFRGFLLTGQENFLAPYYKGQKLLPVLVTEQRNLLSTERQRLRLDTINSLHKEWTDYADSLIAVRRDTLHETSSRIRSLFDKKLKMAEGKNYNDEIRLVFGRLEASEYKLRQERREKLTESIDKTKNISISITLMSIVLGLVSCIFFVRSITARINRMVDFAKTISEGVFITISDDRHDEMSKLAEALNKMSGTLDQSFKELSKKNSELDQFAYVVSHDLKAPIRGIANILSWTEEDFGSSIDPRVKKNHAMIKGRIERLEGMINGLLEYARIGKIKRGKEEVNTYQMVCDLKEVLVPRSFEVKIDAGMPTLITEKILLEQVFANLLSNAVKYNDKQPGRIEIGFQETPEFYEFSVSDNGKGIDNQYFEKIFVIFQTLQERDAFESTGVGLAIVGKIIEDHKGKIVVNSTLGEGTTFTFTWPKK